MFLQRAGTYYACLFVCVAESLPVSVTQKFCNSPHYHLTSIKGQQYLHIREHQETQKLSGHTWLYFCTEALFCQSPRVSFLQRSTHSSLCAGFRGNVVDASVIKCENMSVGEDFKEVCISLEPGELRSASRLTETISVSLRLRAALPSNNQPIFTT